MATVYLHIGTMKTGTTAIQSFMRENKEQLARQGYCYPYFDLGFPGIYNNRNAHFLVFKSKKKDEAEREQEEKGINEAAYQKLVKLAKRYQNIVLSDEVIWHLSKKRDNYWVELVEQFRKIGCDLKVVVYLRRQDLLVQSLWNQKVKSFPGLTMKFQDYIDQDKFFYYPLDYYSHLMKIAEGVGKENVKVRVYEKEQFEGSQNDIFSDFLETIGVEYNDGFTRKKIIPNPGLEGNYLEMKRILNEVPEYKQTDDFLKRSMIAASNCRSEDEKQEKTSLFRYEDQLAYMAKYEESNRKIAIEFLDRADGVLFREPIERLRTWEPDYETMYRDIIIFATEVFCAQENRINKLENNLLQMQGEIRDRRKMWEV